MNSILVKDHMTYHARNAPAVNENCSVREAVQQLTRARLIGLPVVDDNRKVIGFISEQDCIKEMLNNAFFCEDSVPVKSVMSREVLTVSPNTSIVEVAELMTKNKPKIYPVVVEGRLVGLISRSTILHALLETSEDCYLRV